jgi:hypothetical protein
LSCHCSEYGVFISSESAEVVAFAQGSYVISNFSQTNTKACVFVYYRNTNKTGEIQRVAKP